MTAMPPPEQPSLIVRQKSPPNLEFPFASLSDWLVPTNLFFVRNHFPSPDLDAREWRLRVDGTVKRPLELDLDSIKAMRSTTLAAVVECAGNGRVYYEPPREGLQWQNGAVGNAAWTGVLLRDILAAAGVKDTAVEVVVIGADSGVVDGGKKTVSPGRIAFARSLPLAKAVAESTLLAHSMNEAPLTRDHGYPLRAVVGGWFGMAWVKWAHAHRGGGATVPRLLASSGLFSLGTHVGTANARPPFANGSQSAERASREWGEPRRRPTLSDSWRRLVW